MNDYASLVSDPNPIHRSEPLSSSSTPPIVHGMLVASLFSSILGTLVPGAVYRSQTLKFEKPVYVDDVVVARIDVEKLRTVAGQGVLMVCKTTVTRRTMTKEQNGDTVDDCVRGEAQVWLPMTMNDEAEHNDDKDLDR